MISAFGFDKYANKLDMMSGSAGHLRADSSFRDKFVRFMTFFTYYLNFVLDVVKILLFQIIFQNFKMIIHSF